jgi:ketosteroid isomerase-like protein
MMADAPIDTVRHYVEALNRNDGEAMAASFTAPASIAPHLWLGPTPSQDWYRDVLADFEKHGVSELFVGLGEPRHNNVTGDSAYIVIPATMAFKVQGKTVNQGGAMFTVALRKVAQGWRIAAWAWAKGVPVA